MKSAHSPKHWQQVLRGPYLAEQLQARLTQWAPTMFGFNLLTVDALSASFSLAGSRLLHSVHLSQTQPPCTAADIVGDATAMPFAPGSLDACLLAHVLDFSDHPHAILREVETVLRDDGWLIISGFNPYSSAGLASILPGISHKLPSLRHMVAPERLEDWLKLLGFEVLQRDYFGLTPVLEFPMLSKLRQQLVPHYCPSFAAVYVMLARKRRYPLTPIRQTKRKQHVLQPGMARQKQQVKISAEHQAKTQTIFATKSAESTEK
ncbi:methyltransferase [Oceanisphaera profunda]|uniref:Methyltransferase n=1 Tax=Oceanisphaera profunda TaxID=1416627 RepID=A0A1Y0D7C2_9GAMM|nr:class I SAM-dependent methyltransferase [Oceanisphaera profunda]ART83420.1 methyltransferase [Oceanisphaera profunda]